MRSPNSADASSIGVILNGRGFYVSKPSTSIAEELGVKLNRLGGLTLPWSNWNDDVAKVSLVNVYASGEPWFGSKVGLFSRCNC